MHVICRFFCSECDVGFDFPSKYERHIGSSKHRMYSQLLAPDLLTDEDTVLDAGGLLSDENASTSCLVRIIILYSIYNYNSFSLSFSL